MKLIVNVNDYHRASLARVEQLKNQKKSRIRREQEAKRKVDARRHFIIGGLVCKYFPEAMEYQPRGNDADDAEEFATFANVLRLLAEDTGLIEKLKQEAAKL